MILRCDYLFPCHLANALHQPFRSQGLAPNGSGDHGVRKRPLLNGTTQAGERPEGAASPPTEGRRGAGEGRDHDGLAEVGLLLTAGWLFAGLEGTATVGGDCGSWLRRFLVSESSLEAGGRSMPPARSRPSTSLLALHARTFRASRFRTPCGRTPAFEAADSEIRTSRRRSARRNAQLHLRQSFFLHRSMDSLTAEPHIQAASEDNSVGTFVPREPFVLVDDRRQLGASGVRTLLPQVTALNASAAVSTFFSESRAGSGPGVVVGGLPFNQHAAVHLYQPSEIAWNATE